MPVLGARCRIEPNKPATMNGAGQKSGAGGRRRRTTSLPRPTTTNKHSQMTNKIEITHTHTKYGRADDFDNRRQQTVPSEQHSRKNGRVKKNG